MDSFCKQNETEEYYHYEPPWLQSKELKFLAKFL